MTRAPDAVGGAAGSPAPKRRSQPGFTRSDNPAICGLDKPIPEGPIRTSPRSRVHADGGRAAAAAVSAAAVVPIRRRRRYVAVIAFAAGGQHEPRARFRFSINSAVSARLARAARPAVLERYLAKPAASKASVRSR
jgi:hypothetical protein